MEFQCGDIALRQSKGILGKIIRFVLRYFQKDEVNFSHVGCFISPNMLVESGWHIKETPKDEFFGSKAKYIKVIRFKGLTDIEKHIIGKRLVQSIGEDYNIWRLILQLFDNIFSTNWFTKHLRITRDWHICSSLVAWAYDPIGIKFNGVSWESVEPDDIDDESIKNENWITIYLEKR